MKKMNSREGRRGNMLAMAFVFFIFHLLVLLSLQQRLTLLAIVEEKIAKEDSLPEPGAIALAKVLDDLQNESLSNGEERDYPVSYKGSTYVYSASFTDNTTNWSVELTPPSTLPSAYHYDENLAWPEE